MKPRTRLTLFALAQALAVMAAGDSSAVQSMRTGDMPDGDLQEGALFKNWLVAGPFPTAEPNRNPPAEATLEHALDRDYLAGVGGETNVQPRSGSGFQHGGKEYRWQPIASDGGMVNFGNLYGEGSHLIAYAWAEIKMTQAQSVLLGIGSDDAVKIWCNGQLVHRNWTARFLHRDDDLAPVDLHAGTNCLLIKVQNRTEGWGFACRALDPRAATEKLQAAIERNDLDQVKLLVAHGAAVNHQDQHGFTAWHLARVWGREELAKHLQQTGTDQNIAMPDAGAPAGMLRAIWTTLTENHPGLELAGVIDNAWYEACKAKLGTVSNLTDALPIIDEMVVTRLQDFHTSLHWPTKPSSSYLPVDFGFVDNQVVLTACRDTKEARPGDIVLEFDGRNARQQFESALAEVPGPTRFERIRAVCRSWVRGAKGSRVRLKLQLASGQVREVTLERGSPAAARRESLISSRILDERTGYIRITQWNRWSIGSFDALLEPMRDKPRLIIDVRDNGGGQDELADLAIGRFLTEPVMTSISFRRTPNTNQYTKRLHLTKPRGPWRYEGRVAVVFNEGCHSACEHFLSGMQLAGALLVGRPTSGGCGGIQPHELPLGITLYCSRSISLHGNRPPLGGIEPHHLVEPTITDIREGRDAFLNRAVELLSRRVPALAPPGDHPVLSR